MKNTNLTKNWLSQHLALSLLFNLIISVPFPTAIQAQQNELEIRIQGVENNNIQINLSEKFTRLQKSAQAGESRQVLRQWLGANQAAETEALIDQNGDFLFRAIHDAAAEELRPKIENRVKSPSAGKNSVGGNRQTRGFTAPSGPQNIFNFKPSWRTLAFGFQPLAADEKPQIKIEKTETGINVTGEMSKAVETDAVIGTRTQKSESRTIKDGNRYSTEIKDTTIVDLKMKTEPRAFREEITIRQLVETPLCPDAEGLLVGTAKSEVSNKTTIRVPKDITATSVSMIIDLKMTARVDDNAELISYDVDATATEKRFGIDRALARDFITKADAKDGDYSLRYRINGVKPKIKIENEQGESIENPAQPGNAKAFINSSNLTQADIERVNSKTGALMPMLYYYIDQKLNVAREHWRGSGCVEVELGAPKTTLKPDEQIEITARSIHKLDKNSFNAELRANYSGEVTPENQPGTPAAKFILTAPSKEQLKRDKTVQIFVESISRRGIGSGNIEFSTGKVKPKEEPTDETNNDCETGWNGTITVERKLRKEKQKHSGGNLSENGGHEETDTRVTLKIGGAKRDESSGETNAFLIPTVAKTEGTDFEYHKYASEEGFCGAAAAPYKGSLEKTRTSKTTAEFNGEISVLLGMSRSAGTINFSLPELNGKIEHAETHKSACDFNDRANTKKSTNDGVIVSGGSFSVTFPIDPNKQNISGSQTVREEDGSVTIYTYQLTRCGSANRGQKR